MPFENFHKESDKPDRRPQTALGVIFIMAFGVTFLVLLFYCMISFFVPVSKYPTEPDKKAATYTERQRRVDELCASLPKPEEFYFDGKFAPTETSDAASIIYTFKSSRSKEEIYPAFILWFGANGWADDKSPYDGLEFSKDKQTVWIAPYSSKKGDYFTVNCTEWKIE